MTSIQAQQKKDPIIPIEPTIPFEDYKEILLSLERPEPAAPGARGGASHWTKFKEKAIFCTTSDKETLIRTIIEFEDVSGGDRMDIENNITLKFKYFRQCLGCEIRTIWDYARAGKPDTEDGWDDAIAAFIAHYFKPADFHAQKKYMEGFFKPKSLSVTIFADRLITLTTYLEFFPGCVGEPYDATALKGLLFNAMPLQWQVDFAKAGHDINTDAYTYKQLETYMANHEVLASWDSQSRQKHHGGRFNNGRGQERNRGGRNSGYRRNHNDNNSNGNQESKRNKDTCKNHPNGSHSFYDCSLNPKSSNYRPPNNDNGNGRGGGRGRGNNNSGGRGHGGGRGGCGRGNYNNNRGNQNNNNNNNNNSDNFQQDQNNQGNNNQEKNGNNNNQGNSNGNNGNNNNQGNNNQDNHWMDSLQY